MHEIIVYGGGEYYRDVLNGVALMAGGISGYIKLIMLVGLAFAVIKMAFDLDVKAAFRWFMMSMIIYTLMWVPKVQVHVTDVFNPALTGADVANVPIALGVTASVTSKVGHRVTQLTEQAFAHPGDVAYSKTGMIFGAKIFEGLRRAQIADPVFDQNLRSFVKGCIYYDLLEGHYSIGELARQNDLWTYVTATKGTNPGRSIEYVNQAGAGAIVSCTEAAAQLNGQWNGAVLQSAQAYQRRLTPDLREEQLQTAFLQEMNALHPFMVGASRDAVSSFQQVLMANALRRSVPGFAAEAGGDAMNVFAETQAELQTRNQQRLMGGVAEKAVPMLKILTELLIIGIFPVLFPMMLLPNIGLRVLQGFVGGFLYLQLWGPMYAILHMVMMGQAAKGTAAAAYIPGIPAGINMANLDGIGALNAEISDMAGYLSLSIPALASMLGFMGAAAVGRGGESLMASFRGGAEAAAGTATTGNISLGNTAFANHSFQNLSGMRQHTSADLDFGASRWVDSGLSRVEQNGAGTVSMTRSPMSQTAVQVKHAEAVSAAAVQAASQRRQENVDLQHSVQEGRTRAQSESSEFVQQWMAGTSSNWTTGRDDRQTWGAMEQMMDSQAQQLVNSYGLTETQAKQVTARAAMEAYGQAGLSSPTKLIGLELGGGVKASAGIDGSRSSSTSEQNALNAARTSMSNHSFSDRYDQAVANYAQESFSRTQSASTSEALKRSDSFTSSRSINDTMSRNESLAKAYEERADYSRTQSAAAETTYNNMFESYAIQKLTERPDAYGVPITVDRAREILSGRSEGDMRLLNEVTSSFHQDMATNVQLPEMITQHQNLAAGAEAASPGQVRVLQDGSAGDLRGGLGRGSEGRPGGAFSLDAGENAREGRGGASTGGDAPPHERQAPQSPRHDEIREPEPAAPGPGWAGESRLQPGFNSPLRDRIRADTDAAGEALATQRAPNFEKGLGRAFGEVVSDTTPLGRPVSNLVGAVFDREGAHPQGHQAAAGAGSRLARRHAD